MFSICTNVLMLSMPLYTLHVFESVVPTGSLETLLYLSIMAAAALAALALIELVRDRILLRAGLWLEHVLGQHMLENGLKLGLPMSELKVDARSLGALKSALVGGTLVPLFDAPWVPLLILVLYVIHPTLGLLAIGAAVVLLILAAVQGLTTGSLHNDAAHSLERSEQWWTTLAGNAQAASALGLSTGAAQHWELSNRNHVVSAYTLGKHANMLRALARTLRVAVQMGIYGVGGMLVIAGELTSGALVTSAILIARVLSPFENLVGSLRSVRQAWTAYQRLKAHAPDASRVSLGEGRPRPEGHISLSDATYYYAGRRMPALRGATLALKPGECLGIVGPNGSGKSTLAAMLAGAIAPTTGSALLDALPLTRWQRSNGPPAVGYLEDNPTLVEGSVHENVARFRDSSLIAVARAAMRAGVHDALVALPAGYDSPVGPAGRELALRERRAVAFARALHGDPRLVVLDEPELGLDGQSMKQLMTVLQQLKADGVGVIIATQDPRLLRISDKVALMAGGSIQAFGPSAEVMRRLEQTARKEPQVARVH